VRDLPAFRHAVSERRRAVGHTQQQLAAAVGLSPQVLSRKLSGNGALLSARDAVAIATALTGWGALAERGEVVDLLALLGLPAQVIPDSAWGSGPLARLRRAGPSPWSGDGRESLRLNPTPLPAPLNALVGREEQLAAVELAVTESRLVTLTGVGGTGKTRLAVESARRLADRFPHGVAFADMSAVHDTSLAATVLARALGLAPTSVAAAESQLRNALRDAGVLMLADNLEQLRGVGAVLARVLAAAPGSRMLVTSRIALLVSGEHIVRVPPLALPPPGADRAALLDAEAVQMFRQRARAAGSPVESDEDVVAVAEICRALDGLPLAIELAAARAATFTPEALVVRLHDRMELGDDNVVDRPHRHRALRATLDWSYALLDPQLAHFFERLGVFAATFDVPSAAALQEPAMTDDEAERMLLTLAEHSMVRVMPGPVAGMMETVRAYARGRLADRGELDEARRRYLRYLTGRVAGLRATLNNAGDVEAYRAALLELQRSYPDILAALAFAAQGDRAVLEDGFRLAVAALPSWVRSSGPAAEGLLAVTALLDAEAGKVVAGELRAAAMLAAASLAHYTADYRLASRLAEGALPLVRDSQDWPRMAMALRYLGESHLQVGDASHAEAVYRELLDVTEMSGEPARIAMAYNLIADAARVAGRLGQAEDAIRRGLRLRRSLTDPLHLPNLMLQLAEIARDKGQYGRSRRLLCALVQRFHALESRILMANGLEALATTLSLDGVGGAQVFTLVAAAQRLREQTVAPRPPTMIADLERGLAPAVARTPADERAAAEARGWTMATGDVIALAVRLAAEA
jgi:predicted ATPase